MAVRRAVAGDESTLCRLRLAAMADAPAAFGSTLEREAARSREDWARWIAASPTFFWEPAGEARGLVAAVPDRSDVRIVNLVSMWVEPGARGGEGAADLIAAVLGFAAKCGATRVRLAVEQRNSRARRCYERNGFVATGREVSGPRAGMVEVEMELVLPLRP